ncbi:SH3 domain-containing protein [Thermodesulfobacteriota bacterium]
MPGRVNVERHVRAEVIIRSVFLGFALLLSSLSIAGDDRLLLFVEANQAYRAGQYAEAAEKFESLVRQSPVGGGVFFNLGNCYFRLDRPGLAMLNYERAHILIPRDPDLDFNLRYVRDRVVDRAEKHRGAGFLGWLDSLTSDEVFWGVFAVHLLFWCALTLRCWFRSEWSYYLAVALCIVWVLAFVFGGVKWYGATRDFRAVVVADEISVRAGPDPDDTLLFQLHEGTVVTWEREEDGWFLIRFSEQKRGWTQRNGIALVRPVLSTAPAPERGTIE